LKRLETSLAFVMSSFKECVCKGFGVVKWYNPKMARGFSTILLPSKPLAP